MTKASYGIIIAVGFNCFAAAGIAIALAEIDVSHWRLVLMLAFFLVATAGWKLWFRKFGHKPRDKHEDDLPPKTSVH